LVTFGQASAKITTVGGDPEPPSVLYYLGLPLPRGSDPMETSGMALVPLSLKQLLLVGRDMPQFEGPVFGPPRQVVSAVPPFLYYYFFACV